MVTVRSILDMPELRLSVRTGATGLDRPVTRIYGTELPDPGRFLSGGELVLSGLLWLRSDTDVAPFVAALERAGVAGLIACDADTGVIPPALVEECARRDVPLLEAAVDLSFALITDRVGLALAASRIAVPRGGALITALGRGAELAELVAIGSRELGAPCWVLSPLGRVVAGPELAPARVARLVRDFLRHTGRSRAGSTEVTLLPVDDPGPDLTRWFLAVGGDRPADELLGVTAVQRAREREGHRVGNRVLGALLRAVLSGSARPAELVSTALAAGLAVTGELRVLSLAVPGATPDTALAVLEELLAPDGVAAEVDGEVYALLPARSGDPGWAAALRLLEPGLGARRIVLGIGSAASVTELHGAVQEARHARRVGEQRPGRTEVVAGAEVALHRLLLATVPDELRRALRRRLLGPLTDYDAAHGSDLLGTLAVFLDSACSWTRAAAELHVHVNTLRYRIGVIERLTALDLTDFAHRVDLYLALHAEP